MNKKVFFFILSLLFCSFSVNAQSGQKSELHERAESADKSNNVAQARSLYIHAFNDYAGKSQLREGVECAVKAASLYYKENYYQEAFDLLRRADQVVLAAQGKSERDKAALHYLTTKERMQMYIKLKRSESARSQLSIMESQAEQSGDENVKNDLLYNKAIFYYTFGQNAQGNAVFKEMAAKLTTQKEYDKVDEVYQTLIANGRKSGNANMVAQSYISYIAWKDSINAIKAAEDIAILEQKIADNESVIAEKDSSLISRQSVIIGLGILAAVLAGVLVFGAIVLLRFMHLTHKQKKNIRLLTDSNSQKAKFLNNISAQLEPTLKRIDSRIPEVKALLDFSSHIQTLSELENTLNTPVELEDVQVQQLCNSLMDQIRSKVKSSITLTVNAPSASAKIHKEYVSYILSHLLNNAVEFTPEGGTICLDFKKRGPHTFHFIVTDSGQGIPLEKQEEVFKPFRETRDLTNGDGLGLPICKLMAAKMNGDLNIDAKFTKGTRFILDLHA